MNFTQSFRLALKSLMTSKMRALLTMLGIIIGVGAVIVITSLGNGMQQMMNQQQAQQMQQAQYGQPQGGQQPSGDTWTCTCGAVNTGKFCPNCGKPRP